ncbi:MAG: DUF4190 domain-containing protein [Phycisphaera sp.]|nr:MAG: DUF4190 domain-containing protein [Phycisphaera sp.]
MADYYYTDASRQPAGPVPLEQLKGMFEKGELANGALAAEVGATEWEPVAAMFGQPATGGVGYSTPPVVPTGNIGRPEDEFEPLAGWAFGLGLASWFCLSVLAAIPGVILGHMALGKMKRTGNTNSSAKVLAIIGLIASYLHLGLALVYFGVVLIAVVFAMANP